MRRAKRLIVAMCCIALVLTSTLLVVAACGAEGYSVTVSLYDEDKGSVTVSPPKSGTLYAQDEQVTVTVTPKEGYKVDSFKVNGADFYLQEGKCTFEVTQDTTIAVTFADDAQTTPPASKYTLSFALGEHAAEDATVPESQTLASGAKYTLPDGPEAEEGYTFAGWGEERLAAGYLYTMPGADTTLTAQWTQEEPTRFAVNVAPSEHGAVDLEPELDSYAPGTQVTVTATPYENYEIFTFLVNDQPVNHTDGVYTFSVLSDTDIEVIFAPIEDATFTLNTRIEGEGSVQVSPEGAEYSDGTTLTVGFTPAEGYELCEYTVTADGTMTTYSLSNNGIKDGTDPEPYVFDIGADTYIVAKYRAIQQEVTEIPAEFHGQWTQINPLTPETLVHLDISASEFKYNSSVYTVVHSVEGYACKPFKIGSMIYPFGFVDSDKTVLYVRLNANIFLFTLDGQIPDGYFPEVLRDTKWDEDTFGRLFVYADGKAYLTGEESPSAKDKIYLLGTTIEDDTYTLQTLYNGNYWELTYTAGADTLKFSQPGGKGQNDTYTRVVAQLLDSEYEGRWTLVGGDKVIAVERGVFNYEGDTYPTLPANRASYAYDFKLGNKDCGIGKVEGVDLLFVINFTDNTYELYIREGASLPSTQTPDLEDYEGDWVCSDGEQTLTMHIGDGKITIDGVPIVYWGQGYSSDSEYYYARVIYNNIYYDIIIYADRIVLGNFLAALTLEFTPAA